MTIKDLSEVEQDQYYARYINKLSKDINLHEGFRIGEANVIDFFKSIPEDKHNYRYETNKWSVKEILQHLTDTERIFMYRCFRIARNDKTSLAGFDQDIYIKPSHADKKSMHTLITEFKTVRQSFISLLDSLSDDDLNRIGNANDNAMSARAAAFIIIGHEIWHMEVIKERYLGSTN